MNRWLQILYSWLGIPVSRKRRMVFSSFATTDRGLVRADNQDHYSCRPDLAFLCVADGMGGGSDGSLASQWACEAMEKAVADVGNELVEREPAIAAAFEEVNARIRTYAKEHGYKTMGTTMVGLVADPSNAVLARIFHVGDSRAYRFRYGRLDPLTRDHTVGNELGQAMVTGNAAQARVLQARSNPLTHILTRALGTEMKVRPEWRSVDLQRGDRLLFCSDGVHDLLDDSQIREILSQAATPRVAVARLEAAVRKAGAHDNYTIVCTYIASRRM